jgi:hypothetical protein
LRRLLKSPALGTLMRMTGSCTSLVIRASALKATFRRSRVICGSLTMRTLIASMRPEKATGRSAIAVSGSTVRTPTLRTSPMMEP